jgi:hypothetical protein
MDEKQRKGLATAQTDAEASAEAGSLWIQRDHAGAVIEPQTTPSEDAREEPAEGLAGLVQAVAEPVHGHIVGPVAGALGTVIGAANTALSGRNAAGRRSRRLAREPLANLYELYPEARQASPRELGLRFVPLEEIRGTAVAGAAQRGGDFLPLKPFRGDNWETRWRRIQAANDRLVALPPVDLVKYADSYWVVDGHNRVAVALYANGTGLDAMVTELVPLDGRASAQPSQLLGLLSEAGEMRAAAQGHRPAIALDYDARSSDAPEADEPEGDEPEGDEPEGDEPEGETGRPLFWEAED